MSWLLVTAKGAEATGSRNLLGQKRIPGCGNTVLSGGTFNLLLWIQLPYLAHSHLLG